MVIGSVQVVPVTGAMELRRWWLIRETVVMMGHALATWRVDGRDV